jgi:DNA-binding MarR family transcriptional regulator
MELRHLQTLVAVAEEGSFSRAAERLRIAQSAVSRTIRDLERELGRSLFDRSTHHVELTVAGQLTLDRARATLAAAHAIGAVRRCPGTCDRPASEAGDDVWAEKQHWGQAVSQLESASTAGAASPWPTGSRRAVVSAPESPVR